VLDSGLVAEENGDGLETGGFPAVGQTVVVQFGRSDTAFTRCEATEVGDRQITLRPFDRLSGAGMQGDSARLIFTRAGQANFLHAAFAEDAVTHRLVVVLERRSSVRHPMDLLIDVSVASEAPAVKGQLRDLSIGGLRAYVAESLPDGLRIFVSICDDRRELVAVVGEVVTTTTAGVGATDTHVRFVAPSHFTLKRLQGVLPGTGAREQARSVTGDA
jgi:hypothetical protein